MEALDTTEAATPNASSIPRAPTGSWKLSRIDGQRRPRVDPGRATVRYAKQARRNGGTEGAPLSREKNAPGLWQRQCSEPHPRGELAVPFAAARDDRSVGDLLRQRVRRCPGTSAPRSLHLSATDSSCSGRICECPSKARLYLRQRRRPAIGKGMAVPAHNARGDRLRTAPEAGMARASRRSARRARNKRLQFGSPVRGGRRSRRAPNQPSPESSDAMSGDVVARRSWRGSRVHGPWRAVAGARD